MDGIGGLLAGHYPDQPRKPLLSVEHVSMDATGLRRLVVSSIASGVELVLVLVLVSIGVSITGVKCSVSLVLVVVSLVSNLVSGNLTGVNLVLVLISLVSSPQAACIRPWS